MARVALVTDSTACLSQEEARARDIRVVPLHVVIDGVELGEDTLLAEPEEALVARLRAARKIGTSRPSPAALLAAYEEAARAGAEAVVSIHLSGHLSGTVDAAILAASRSPVPVEVVDTQQAGMAQGHAVLTAAAAVRRGATSAQVGAAALARADDATTTFYVESLEHLRRGGRIGGAAALLGSTLAIKPILGLEDGAVRPVAKVRTAAKAVDRLVGDAVAAVGGAPFGCDVVVQSLGADARAAQIRERIEEACPETAVTHRRLGPVLGAHVGPGTVAVVVAPRPAPTSVGA